MIATGNWGACEWTISDEGELRFSAGTAERVSEDGTYPWDEYRDGIRSISFEESVTGVGSLLGAFMNCSQLEQIDFHGLDTSGVIDMSWMLCGCGRLKEVDLSMLDTGKVLDMSCMFLSCRNLQKVNFGSIDTSSVLDMSKMFMYCSSLRSLDIATLDNSGLQMSDDMFFGCSGLRAVAVGRDFSMGGGGRTLITLPEISETQAEDSGSESEETVQASSWRTSVDGVLYVAGSEFTFQYDGNGGAEVEENQEKLSCKCVAGTRLMAGRDLFRAPGGMIFKEWNTRADGSGREIQPGQMFYVHADMTLYAIWAGSPAFLEVYDIPPVTYGQILELTEPRMDSRHGEITSVRAEIKDPGQFEWKDFPNDEPLPVARSGARIRFVAENYVGSSASEERVIQIDPAEYDMSGAHWVLPEDLSYDGQEKEVHLEGLPEGVTAEYAGNTAAAVGRYRATAVLICDEENYIKPDPVEDLVWNIAKGKYKVKDLKWTYMEAFTYDGEEKSIRLEGLPEGTVPYYSGADAVDAGTYVATVGLDYDIDNYNSPDPIRPCTWKILKSSHDMSSVHWESPEYFVYDSLPKRVELTGLPEGVRAEYTGNVAANAGTYTARAAFVLDDPVNYEIPEPISFEWEIRKNSHNVDQMTWTENTMVYDGSEHQVMLEGIPKGVSVLYEGNTAVDAGVYTARAEFCVDDLNNYNQMDPITLRWEIKKAEIDLEKIRWNYSSPYIYNGLEKSVELKEVPEKIEIAGYTGERGTNVGSYTAHALIDYDRVNYNPPQIEDCEWKILKANLKLQDLTWNYERPFIYDGLEHSVHITNLPENATVEYEGNCAADVGKYECTALITPTDLDNYNMPEPLKYSWEIRRAVFDISGFHWDREPKVFDGGTKSIEICDLPEGVSVTYEGNEAVEAGEYTARAVFQVADSESFLPPAPEEIRWHIDPAPIDLTGVSWDYSAPFTYDGSEKEVRLTGLPEGVTARYEGNVASDVGEYAAKAVLIPPEGTSFRETEVLGRLWRIEKADIDLSGISWDCPSDYVYNGLLKEVHLTGIPDELRVEYEGNEAIDAGSYTARAILTPYDEKNYNVPPVSSCSWKIGRKDIDMSEVCWSGHDTFVYDGTVHRVVLKNLPDLVDAVYEGNSAADAGNYIASAQFRPKDQRNYNTPRMMQCEWSVDKAQLSRENVYWTSGDDDLIYNGKEHTVWLEGLVDGVSAEYRGNTAVDAGQYIASAVLVAEDDSNYLPCVIDPYRWRIEQAEIDITDVMWASSGELVYDGTIKVVGLTGLSDDIAVEYENNVAVDAGTYHASAVLSIQNNNYTAPEIEGCTWTIAKAAPDISNVVWNYALEFTYDGYEKSVELMNLPEGMSVAYHGNAAIEAGNYVAEAAIIMDDPMNYETPEIAPLHWTIGKRDYDMSNVVWVGTKGLVYDGTAKSVKLKGLEDGLEPIYYDNVAVESGVYEAKARFLYDEDNYNPPPDVSCRWEIRKAPLDTSGVRWNYDGPFKASGRPHTVTLAGDSAGQGFMGKMLGHSKEVSIPGLPAGTKVRYEGNTAKAPGVYEARAYLTIPPQANHDVSEPICLRWEIIDG